MEIYKEIDTLQGSDEWLLWRRCHLTATDSSKILGRNPWASALDCYHEKLDGKKYICTPAMQRGTMLEPKARELLMSIYGINLKAKVFESVIYPYAGASLDAISDDNKIMYEIKAPGMNTMNKAFKGEIEQSYIIQCNKQMLVMGIESMSLFYYYNEFLHHEVKVERDENLIKQIIKAESNFWNKHILVQVPPEKYGDEYKRVEDEHANELAERWQELNEQEKEAKKEKESVVKQLEKYTQDKNCIFTSAGIKHQVIERKGSVDWKQVSSSYSITEEDLSEYRKNTSKYSKFSEI